MALKLSFNIFILFLISFDCNQEKTIKSNKVDKSTMLKLKNFDYVNSFKWEGNFDKATVLKNLQKSEYSKFIYDCSFLWEGKIQTLGKCIAYSITLSGDQPGMYRGNKVLLICKETKKGYIIWIETFDPLKLNLIDSVCHIGGREFHRNYGNYFVYEAKQDTIFKIFETPTIVNNSRLDECKRFKGGQLKLSLKDLDNNGFNDLIFEGVEYTFCKDLAEEILDNPVDSSYIKLIYKTTFSNNTISFTN